MVHDTKKIRSTRIQRNMTQAQLADVLGCGQSMVAMLEDGNMDARPSKALIDRINRWLASGKGPRTKTARGPYQPKRGTLPR